MSQRELKFGCEFVFSPVRAGFEQIVNAFEQLDCIIEACAIVERLGVGQCRTDLVGRHLNELETQEQGHNRLQHRESLRENHLDRSIPFRDPMTLRCKVWIFKHQNTTQRYSDVAQWRLTER